MRAINWAAELDAASRRHADRIAVEDEAGAIRYRDLFRRAAAAGSRLIASGVRPGEPVATLLRNGIPAVWASYGVMLSGAAEVPLNPALGAADRRHCLALTGARRIVTTADAAPEFRELGLEALAIEDIGEQELAVGDFPSLAPDSMARVVFTSGTTGLPKGAVHDQETRWLANLLLRANLPIQPRPGSRLLLTTPFSHGASLMTLAYLGRGASVTLLDGVDPDLVLPMLERGEIDEMFAPPTVLSKLVEAAGDRRIPGLKTIFCGTAVLSPSLYQRAKRVFGPVVRVTYGKSEVFNPIAVLEAEEVDAWYTQAGADADACVGWPSDGVEIAIRTEDGTTARPGEGGEVLIRAQHLMRGYLRLEGYEPLPADGFHDTGDLGYFDDCGRLHLTGRLADMIKTGGYKVSPEEVERALAPALVPSALAAIGIPSEYWGEVIVVAVENPSAGWERRAREAAAQMTSYKRPRAYVAMETLPLNGIGKIRRAAIRASILEAFQLVDGPKPRLESRPGAYA